MNSTKWSTVITGIIIQKYYKLGCQMPLMFICKNLPLLLALDFHTLLVYQFITAYV